MSRFDGPHPPDPFLTKQQQLMVDLGWLELWHAQREDLTIDHRTDHGPAAENG